MTESRPLRALTGIAWVLLAPLLAFAFMFAAPQAASILHAGRTAPLNVAAAIAAAVRLLTHGLWSDPAGAYPPAAQVLMPAAAGFYAAVAWMLAVTAAAAVAVWRRIDRTVSGVRVGRRRYSPRGARPRTWARPRDLGRLLVDAPVPGRLHAGWIGRPARLVACEPDVNLAVIAPTRAGKTSCGVIPWLLEHPGPVVALSTKPDVLQPTLARREAIGRVWQWNPFAAQTTGWNPLSGCEDWTAALLTARWLTDSVDSSRAASDADVTRYWNREASRLLAPLMHAAALTDQRPEGPRIERLLRWADDPTEADKDAGSVLSEHGADAAASQLAGIIALDRRARSATFQTAGSLLEAYRYPPVQASCWHGISPEQFLDGGAHTLYIVASTRDQRLLRPLVVAMISQVINAAMLHANEHGPLDPPVLFLLDETANIAPLGDLPQYLSTGLGLGIRFVTVWQALAQMHDTYGEASGAILGNSQAKLNPRLDHRRAHPPLHLRPARGGDRDPRAPRRTARPTLPSHHLPAARRRPSLTTTPRRRGNPRSHQPQTSRDQAEALVPRRSSAALDGLRGGWAEPIEPLLHAAKGVTCIAMSDTLRFTIRYSDGGEGWIMAQVEEVPGAISQGRTRPEARENVIDALRLMLKPEPDRPADPDRELLDLPLAS